MASTRGFEPPTPGFIPLQLSLPPAGVRGLDCPFAIGFSAVRRCPSSLYTFTRHSSGAWLGIGMLTESAKRSPTLSRSTTPFRCVAPNLQLSGILCSIQLSYVDIFQLDARPSYPMKQSYSTWFGKPTDCISGDIPAFSGVSVSFLPLKLLYPAELPGRGAAGPRAGRFGSSSKSAKALTALFQTPHVLKGRQPCRRADSRRPWHPLDFSGPETLRCFPPPNSSTRFLLQSPCCPPSRVGRKRVSTVR